MFSSLSPGRAISLGLELIDAIRFGSDWHVCLSKYNSFAGLSRCIHWLAYLGLKMKNFRVEVRFEDGDIQAQGGLTKRQAVLRYNRWVRQMPIDLGIKSVSWSVM
jgi:hypothetical protein